MLSSDFMGLEAIHVSDGTSLLNVQVLLGFQQSLNDGQHCLAPGVCPPNVIRRRNDPLHMPQPEDCTEAQFTEGGFRNNRSDILFVASTIVGSAHLGMRFDAAPSKMQTSPL